MEWGRFKINEKTMKTISPAKYLGENQTNYSPVHQEMLIIFWIMATQREHRIMCYIFNQGPRIYPYAWFQLWVST